MEVQRRSEFICRGVGRCCVLHPFSVRSGRRSSRFSQTEIHSGKQRIGRSLSLRPFRWFRVLLSRNDQAWPVTQVSSCEEAGRQVGRWSRAGRCESTVDNGEHHVSFESGSPWTLFSEPTRLDSRRVFTDVATRLTSEIRERPTALGPEKLEELAESISVIAEKRREIGDRQRSVTREVLRDISPLQRTAYYASVFLESQLFVVQEKLNSE
jgi:hypothetical protein